MNSRLATIALQNDLVHKVCALCIGVCLWSIISTLHNDTVTVTIPVVFHNTKAEQKINAPETITVAIKGTRSDLKSIDYKKLAVHLDQQKVLAEGGVVIQADNLLLPNTVKVVHYTPMNFMIQSPI